MNQKKGFTLVEVMISVVLASILMITFYTLLNNQQKTYNSQDLIVEMQQNVRTVMDTLTRQFRSAGYGVPTVQNPSEIAVITTATENTITFLVDIDNVKAVLTSDYTAGNTTLSVDTVSDTSADNYFGNFPTGDTIYITDGSKWESTSVTSSSDGSLGINALGNDFSQGSVLHVINTITYAQNPSDHKHSTDADTIKVTRSVDGSTAQPVVDDIDYLEFKYYDDSGNQLGNASPYININLSSDEAKSVRKIKVLFVARSSRADPFYTSSGTYNCGDSYNDKYHRITLESEIKLRNAGLE